MRRIWFVLAFLVSFLVVSSSHAVLPVLVYAVARQAVVMTAEAVTVGVIAKGFAANDPYVRTTATLPRSKFARGLSQLRGRWAGLGTLLAAVGSLGWMYEEDIGFYIPKGAPFKGHCNGQPSIVDYDSCIVADFGALLSYQVSPVHDDGWGGQYVWLCPGGVSSSGSCNGGYGSLFVVTGPGETVKVPVTESQMEEQALPLIAASPNTLGDMLAGLSQPQLGQLFDGATIPYNPTDPTPEMAQLKSDYRNGLLQTVDPDAAHYVSLELLRQIQDLVSAEDAANTDDGTIEALNEKIKQPLTQAQYEESNLKTETAQASALSTALAPAFDPFNQLQIDNDFVLDKMNSPSEPPDSLSFFQWSLPTGSCTGFNVDMSVGNGRLHESKNVHEHCPFYNEVAHPLLFWFLNILTFLYVWWIWDRSVSDMAR